MKETLLSSIRLLLLLASVTAFVADDCKLEENVDRDVRLSDVTSIFDNSSVYSCLSCVNLQPAVHVLSVNYPDMGKHTIQVDIVGAAIPRLIQLVLVSHHTAKGFYSIPQLTWELAIPPEVTVQKIILVADTLWRTQIVLPDETPSIAVYKIGIGLGHIHSIEGLQTLLDLLRPYTTYISSLTSRYEASSFVMWLGQEETICGYDPPEDTHLISTVNTPAPAPPEAASPQQLVDCLASPTCLVRFDFDSVSDVRARCGGDRFVHYSPYQGLYAGLVLCSSQRYAIYLSSSLRGTFHPIIDESGHGEDHCEFVGTNDYNARVPNTPSDINCDYGAVVKRYHRGRYGYRPQLGNMYFDEPDRYHCPVWYECNVPVPGDRQVINLSDQSTFLQHIPTDGWPIKTTPDYPTIPSHSYGDCFVRSNSKNARALLLETSQTVFSCVPCQIRATQVHVISVYETDDQENPGNIQVSILEVPDRYEPLQLVLTSYRATTWNLQAPGTANIARVILIWKLELDKEHPSSLVNLPSGFSQVPVLYLREYVYYGMSSTDVISLTYILNPHVTYLTSVTGTHWAHKWLLKPVTNQKCEQIVAEFIQEEDVSPGTISNEGETPSNSPTTSIIAGVVAMVVLGALMGAAYFLHRTHKKIKQRRKDEQYDGVMEQDGVTELSIIDSVHDIISPSENNIRKRNKDRPNDVVSSENVQETALTVFDSENELINNPTHHSRQRYKYQPDGDMVGLNGQESGTKLPQTDGIPSAPSDGEIERRESAASYEEDPPSYESVVNAAKYKTLSECKGKDKPPIERPE